MLKISSLNKLSGHNIVDDGFHLPTIKFVHRTKINPLIGNHKMYEMQHIVFTKRFDFILQIHLQTTIVLFGIVMAIH